MIQIQIRDQLTAAIRDAALQVSENLGVQRLIDSITSYPAKIREQQVVVAKYRRAMEDAKAGAEQAKAIIVAMVATETSGDGKAKYSNKETREAEVAVRMGRDPLYLNAHNHHQSTEEDYNAAQFDLQCLDNEFRAHSKAADLIAAQINFLAGSGQ